MSHARLGRACACDGRAAVAQSWWELMRVVGREEQREDSASI